MKTLDLTFADFCTEKQNNIARELAQKNEIAERNARAKSYSDNVKAKKMHSVKENLLMLAIILCTNATIMYVLVDALL